MKRHFWVSYENELGLEGKDLELVYWRGGRLSNLVTFEVYASRNKGRG